jgi:hypothetical protein
VHVECVATRRAVRPSAAGQLVPADDRTEASDERLHQPRFDGRKADPGALVAQHAVDIELGDPALVLALACRQRRDPRADVGVSRRHANPVLETVMDRRRRRADLDQQKPCRAIPLEPEPPFLLERPTKEYHVHAAGP